ncbi:MAG: hypothetical protein ACLFUB_09980 [Cyclobacteriaceae bacterium]
MAAVSAKYDALTERIGGKIHEQAQIIPFNNKDRCDVLKKKSN